MMIQRGIMKKIPSVPIIRNRPSTKAFSLIVLGGECFHSITFYKEYKKFPLKQIFPLLFYNIIIIKTFVSSSTHAHTSPFVHIFSSYPFVAQIV